MLELKYGLTTQELLDEINGKFTDSGNTETAPHLCVLL